MRLNIVIGGKAGQGPNVLAEILSKVLVNQGYYVFDSRSYQSLIRGGHNFNHLTISDDQTRSNDFKIDIIVAIDENTVNVHSKELKKEGIILNSKHNNMYFAGRLFKLLCLDFKLLEQELGKLNKKMIKENLANAKEGYTEEKRQYCQLLKKDKTSKGFMNGSEGVSEGSIKSGLDIFYSYPMTPATPVLVELAQNQDKCNYLVLELENELAIINAAIGSAMTGAKSMIGTSGGGFDLMTEALSLTGIAEIPMVLYLAQRPGPATGLPTYTAQGDLNMARHAGHGEFTRMLLAPGDPIECQELTSQSFYFSQKFKIPVILISDKHLAESFYTITENPKIIQSEKSTSLKRYNSYEKGRNGSATDVPEVINKNIDDRNKKTAEIEKDSMIFDRYKIFGKKNSKNVILSWGSTKGAVLDSIKDIDCKFIQILYIEPFPKEIEKEIKKEDNIILIENNSTGQLAGVLAEKTGIFIDKKNKILRYDGRPFFADELKKEIQRRLK
ncbi:MAG TPA: 2-oxoacid:acceptor oxidoreductase family protein [Candidatus Nanoarchaeia archaeon]|nr:2-oxoacid:acceptor oxidoreductase family protein [Candidatus Nanoarchaeia archaeon]